MKEKIYMYSREEKTLVTTCKKNEEGEAKAIDPVPCLDSKTLPHGRAFHVNISIHGNSLFKSKAWVLVIFQVAVDSPVHEFSNFSKQSLVNIKA